MKTIVLFLLPMLLMPTTVKTVKTQTDEPTLTRLTFSFHTNDDDKDWDTQIDVQVIYNGYVVGERRCCNVNNGDHWNNGSDSPSPDLEIPINERITKRQLLYASYQVSTQANGNDKWSFDARLHAEFSDGTPRDWTFLSHALDSRGSQWVSNTYPLSDGYR